MTVEEDKRRLREIKAELKVMAQEISQQFNGAPVVVVVGGSTKHDVPAVAAGWANLVEGREGRFRDVVGLLQSAIQIEAFQHYMEDELFQDLKDKM